MVSCENCGAENEDDVNFCRVCGSRLSNQEENLTRIVQTATSYDDSIKESHYEMDKRFELKKIAPRSFGKINYFIFIVLSIIGAIISVIVSPSNIVLSMSNPIKILMVFLFIVALMTVASLIAGVFVFLFSYILAWLYNVLTSVISGIKFNKSPDNKINNINYSSLKIFSVFTIIGIIVSDILLYILSITKFNYPFTELGKYINPNLVGLVDFKELIIYDVSIFILSLILASIFIFLFNLITRKYPLKIDLTSKVSNNSYNLKKIYLKSFILTIGVPLILYELVLLLLNPTMDYVVILIETLIFEIILVPIIYNLLSKKLGGYEVDLENLGKI